MLNLCFALLDVQEEAKFEELYFAYRHSMFYVAYDILHNHHDAEDALQDAFTSIAKSFSKVLKLDPSKYHAYYCRAARNSAINIQIKNRCDRARELKVFENSTDFPRNRRDQDDLLNKICQREDSRTIRSCFNRLPDDYRNIIVLAHIEKLNSKQIGAKLGISSPAARQRLQRAKQALWNLLKEEGITIYEK